MLPLYRTYSATCGYEFDDSKSVYTCSPNGGICARKEIFKRQKMEFIKEKCTLLKENTFILVKRTNQFYKYVLITQG